VVLVVSAMAMTRRRLQQRFGPEYDRVVGEKRGQFRAAAELARRERRVQRLRIRPLSAAARAAYAAEWKTTQEGFVDHPQHAVIEGQELVASVMKERGYPAEDPDQIAADLSVAHAGTLDHYRTAQQIGAAAERGDASTEDLRQALIHVRAVFGELLGKPEATEPAAAEPVTPGLVAAEPVAAGPVAARPQELPQMGRRVPDSAEPRLPEDAEAPRAVGRASDGAGRASDGAEAAESQEQLWRPVRVPPAPTSEEQEASQ
jgi:hypothetical protein